jgi:hypothetical protein
MARFYADRRTAAGAAVFGLQIGDASLFSVLAAGRASGLAYGNPSANFTAGSAFSVAAAGLASTLVYGQSTLAFQGPFEVLAAGRPGSVGYGSPLLTWEGAFTPDAAHPRRLVIVPDPRLQGTTLPGSGGAFLQPFPFSPGARLDIEWDWRAWLNGGDRVDSFTVSWVGEPIGTLSGEALGSDVVRTWLTVPDDMAEGTRASALCTVTTAAGRVDNREFELLVRQL